MRFTTIVIVLLALLMAACGSDQPSEAPSEPDPTPAATPEATEVPSEEPDASEPDEPAASELAFPSSFDINGDPELAARFPDTVDGQPLQVLSMRGDMFVTGEADPAFQDFLDATGADLEDVSVAFGGVASQDSFVSVAAFRVLGVSEEQLEQEFIGATRESGELSGLEEATVGGKEVLVATDATGALGGAGIYIYTKDDTLYWMTGTEDQAAQILEALP